MKRKEEEQRDGARDQEPKEGERRTTAEIPVEAGTSVTFVSQTLPAPMIDINVPSSILQDAGSPSETCVNILATAVSSPTLSFSTVSDLTPTEFGEIEHSEEQTITPHDTFYFEDGNVEIVCGDTVFRVHSTVISFSSSKLRDILSPPILLNAPMPEGCPRVTVSDNAEDFAVLLEMIYTPGWVPPSLEVDFS